MIVLWLKMLTARNVLDGAMAVKTETRKIVGEGEKVLTTGEENAILMRGAGRAVVDILDVVRATAGVLMLAMETVLQKEKDAVSEAPMVETI